jgi:hypothetical protein
VGGANRARVRALATAFTLALLAPSASGAGLPPGPTLTSPPVVIGAATAGKRLTGLSGVWTGTGAITYRYQWSRCNAAGARCRAIDGASGSNYTLSGADVGKTVGLTVRATDLTGSAAAFASLVGPVAAARPLLESTLQPVVSGIPVVGGTLTVSTGEWSPMVDTFTYAWERCDAHGRSCAPIPGATTRSYRIVAADLGHALLALVQATNATTLQNTFSIASPAVVSAAVHGPTPLTPPEATGLLLSGSELIATTGRWQGVGPVSFSFQWHRCDLLGVHCSAVAGATGATYRLSALDVQSTIGLTLRATDLTGTATAEADLVGPVAQHGAALVATGQPTIVGVAQSGDALSVSPGTWSLNPTGFHYRWLRCDLEGRFCRPIERATSATYTATSADVGSRLIVEVEATVGGRARVALSGATVQIG